MLTWEWRMGEVLSSFAFLPPTVAKNVVFYVAEQEQSGRAWRHG